MVGLSVGSDVVDLSVGLSVASDVGLSVGPEVGVSVCRKIGGGGRTIGFPLGGSGKGGEYTGVPDGGKNTGCIAGGP
jgi:hypothetical protein